MTAMSSMPAVVMAVTCAWLMAGCARNGGKPTEAELSAFGNYVERLDSTRLQHALKEAVKADTSHWAADQVVRKHYEAAPPGTNDARWFSRMGMAPEADSMLLFLRRTLPENALDTTAFFIPEIARDLNVVHGLKFDSLGVDINDVLARLEYHLSKAYVRYCAGQRYGFVRPARLLNRLERRADNGEWAQLFDYDVAAPDYDEALRQLLSPARMAYLEGSVPTLPAYAALQRQLPLTADASERQKLAVSMERLRWQMPQPGADERHVVVNIAAQQLWAVCPDSVINMRICCGAVNHKTPLLSSNISYMQVNPEWIIPQSIVNNEVAAHAGDSAYFARNRYFITDRSTGDTLPAATVTRAQMESGRLRLAQACGAGNSLGRIVFRFANNFAVYLHDTNNRAAFNRERRTLSHGCVRVQKPFELATFLLPNADEWKLEQLRLSMDLPPTTERGKAYLAEHVDDERPLRLISYHDVRPRVPVFITYFTAYPDPESGKVGFWPDLYGYDKAITGEAGQYFIK